VAAPSLGQDAALSFVVIGRDQRAEGSAVGGWRSGHSTGSGLEVGGVIQLAADYESNESIFYTFFLSIYVRHRIVCIYLFLNGYCK
jgi:hypothetical protein